MAKLLFKQRFFSWFDSFDVFDEAENVVFTVEGKLAWGHKLEIFDAMGAYLGTVKEEILTLLPRFSLYQGEQYLGQVHREFTFLKPVYTLDCNGWEIQGDFLGWEYSITDGAGALVATIEKKIWNWTDTYELEVYAPENSLLAFMVVLAIDAANCSNK